MTVSSNFTELSLRRVFYEGFSARDLAEPLASFDANARVESVREFMERRPLCVVGIREGGLITGFVEQERADDRPLVQQMNRLADEFMVSTSAPFQDVIQGLDRHRFMLVTELDQPVGVILRNDIEKAPMRMWLFGMVTLIEMQVGRVIREHFENEKWIEYVSETRMNKARQLKSERARRNQDVDLLDCLQFGDKGQLMARSEQLRRRFWHQQSRRRVEKAVKDLERLRNHLAHAQDIITENWEVIVRLSETLDRILAESDSGESSFTPHEEPSAEG